MLTVLEWYEYYADLFWDDFTFAVMRGDKLLAKYDGRDSVPIKYNNMPVYGISEPIMTEDGMVWENFVIVQI